MLPLGVPEVAGVPELVGLAEVAGPLADVDPGAFDKMVDVNLKGPWYLASRLAPRMGEQGGGCVINVLSVAALVAP